MSACPYQTSNDSNENINATNERSPFSSSVVSSFSDDDDSVDDHSGEDIFQQMKMHRNSLNVSMQQLLINDDDENDDADAEKGDISRIADYNDYVRAQRRMSTLQKTRLKTTSSIDEEEEQEDNSVIDSSSPENNNNNPDDVEEKQDLRELFRTYRRMSVVAPRITNPEESAAWESVRHNLEHKIKKLDCDGQFNDDDVNNNNKRRRGGCRIPWYSPPIQRQKWGEDTVLPYINWGDLFFDLFYVAAAYNIGVMLISAINPYDYLRGIIYFIGIFGSLFVTWETEVYYASRYTVVDYAHRLFEVIRFVFVTTAVLNIQPIDRLSNPYDNIEPLLLTLAILLESLMHMALNIELYYCAEGDRIAIQIHTMVKIKKQLIPTSLTYLAAVLCSAVMYGGPWLGEDVINNQSLWGIRDLPITLIAFGYFSNIVYTTLRKVRVTSGKNDVRDTYVPNNVNYIIQRYGEWIMLMFGEVVMALVETTESQRNYFVASFGTLTMIVLHALKSESAPSKADGHALWRNIRNATCFSLLVQVLSIGLIIFGVAYKIFLTDGAYGIPNLTSTSLFCGSLMLVLLSLELMLVSHRGIKRTYDRLFHKAAHVDVNWPLLLVSLFKVAIMVFFSTLPLWNTKTNEVVFMGFIGVTAIALTRTIGWGFVFLEEEIKDFVGDVARISTNAARGLARQVSFAADSVQMQMHTSHHSVTSLTSRINHVFSGPQDQGSACGTNEGDPSFANAEAFNAMSHCSSRPKFSLFSRKHQEKSDEPQAGGDDVTISTRGSVDKNDSQFQITNLGSIDRRVQRVLDDKSFDCIIVINLQGIIQGVNETSVKEFGYGGKEELVGEKLTMLVGGDPGIAKHHDMYLDKFRVKNQGKKEINSQVIARQRVLHSKRKDGSEFRCIIIIHGIKGTDMLAGFIRNIDDVI